MLEAETRFRKVQGYRGLATLAVKIEQDLIRSVNLTVTHQPRRTWPHSLCNHQLGPLATTNFHDRRDNLLGCGGRQFCLSSQPAWL